MTELPEYRHVLENGEIKQRLPLAFAASRLGIKLTSESTAICPFHANGQERNPSFGIYRNERDDERWHCFPCGLDGDVFDLIIQLHGCTFPEAIQQAASFLDEIPEGYERPAYQVDVPKQTPDDWASDVAAARARAAQPDHAGILAARVGFAATSDALLCARWDEYLRSWGWGINGLGEILIPHWSAAKELVGCKVRKPSGEKVSLGGSRYSGQLYGAWRGRREQDVLLLEGETDCVFAGWLARSENVAVDVFALPSGANEDVKPEWVEFLKGARTVYLAFDPDEVGVEATWKWIKALAGFDTKVCCLPLGRDLRDAQPVLRNLLSAAEAPIDPPIEIAVGLPTGFPAHKIQSNIGYFRPQREGPPKQVTNWFLEPIARLAGGDPGYDVTLFHRGRGQRTIIRLADLATARDIKRWCNRHGLVFTGREDDAQRIAEHVTWRGSVTPEVYQTDQVGLHEAPENYQFAGASVVFPEGYVGKMPWRYVPSTRVSDVTDKVFLPVEERFTWSWLDDFISLSSSDVIHPLLAWTIASTRRPEVRQFPLLFIGGSSGVGKSTLARLALRLVGSMIEIDLGAVTPFILLRTLASSTSLPIFIDEWTLMSRKDAREAFQGTIPVLYTGGGAERGQADLSSAIFKMSAPVIVAGEDTFALDRELDRTVSISPSRAGQNKEALARITSVPLERFGQVLHRWLVTRKNLPSMESTAPTRPEYNREILTAGWKTLQLLLDDASHSVPNVPDLPATPDFSIFDTERDEQNVYETALLEGMSMRDINGHQVVWTDAEGRGTWVRFRVLIGLLRTRNVDLQLPGGERAMKRYFEERYGVVNSERTIPPQSGTYVHAGLIRGLISEGENESDPRSNWSPT